MEWVNSESEGVWSMVRVRCMLYAVSMVWVRVRGEGEGEGEGVGGDVAPAATRSFRSRPG